MTEPVVRTRTLADFELREARYAPGYAGSEHRHGLPYFGCVVAGSFIERSPRGHARYGKGSVHAHPAGDPHAGIVGEGGARCFSILPGPRLGHRLAAASLGGEASPQVAALAARCHRGFVLDDLASDLDCEAAALELVAAVLRLATPRERAAPRWLAVARAYLHGHDGGPVTLAALSHACGVHPVHLARAFKDALGVTPAAYLRRLRFERACRELAEGELPLTDVALLCGYASQSHLTRDFRSRLGTTPAAWRRLRRS
jgi:AraC family transcriptional regulator